MCKNKYRVSGKGTEYLLDIAIEAESRQEAESIYRQKWENGNIPALDYELTIEVEEGE